MIIVNYKNDSVGIFDTIQKAAQSFDENAVDMAEFEIKKGIVEVLKTMSDESLTPDQMLMKLIGEGTELWRVTK